MKAQVLLNAYPLNAFMWLMSHPCIHGIEMEWTISSRPGKDNAFLSRSSSSFESSGVDSLAIQVPSVYDPSNNRLYTVTNRNTSIQI